MAISSIGKNVNETNVLASDAIGGKDRVVQAIRQASAKTGVDFAYLMQKAETESSMNPTAQAKTSSARGLYQFVNQTWLSTLDKHAAEYGRSDISDAIQTKNGVAYVADPAKRREILAMRDNPELSAAMAAELAADNADTLKSKVGGDIGGTELYMAHFLGAGGASQFLNKVKNNPGAVAASVLPDAAAANRNIFYTAGGRARTVKEVYDHFAAKFSDTGKTAIADAKRASEQSAAAMQIAQLPMNNSFAAFTGDEMDKGEVAPAFIPASTSNMSANGEVYRMAPHLADQQSMYYALMLADGKRDMEKSGSGI